MRAFHTLGACTLGSTRRRPDGDGASVVKTPPSGGDHSRGCKSGPVQEIDLCDPPYFIFYEVYSSNGEPLHKAQNFRCT